MDTENDNIKQDKLALEWDAPTTNTESSESAPTEQQTPPEATTITEVFDNFTKNNELKSETADAETSRAQPKNDSEESIQLSNGTIPQTDSHHVYPLKTDLHTQLPKQAEETTNVAELAVEPVEKPRTVEAVEDQTTEEPEKTEPVVKDKPAELVKQPEVEKAATPEKPKSASLFKQAEKRINNINFSIGHALQAARKSKDITIEEAAETTRIRHDIIENIENDNFEAAPAPVYTRGYIKKLGELYGTDATTLVEQYNDMISGERKKKPLETPKKEIPAVIDDMETEFSLGPAGVQPAVVSHKTSGGMIKKVAIAIVALLAIYIIQDLFSGNDAEEKSEVINENPKPAVTSQVKPAIAIKDLIRYTAPPKVETEKLKVPKTAIK